MKEKFVNTYMKVAETFAELSSARRLHVGAIVVKDDRIISIGYNGMPSGWDNNCEETEYVIDAEAHSSQTMTSHGFTKSTNGWFRLRTKREVLHAETNAIAKLAKSTESGDGASLFVTHSPCLECAKLIYQSGINSVYYRHSYRDSSGIDFLGTAGVKVQQI